MELSLHRIRIWKLIETNNIVLIQSKRGCFVVHRSFFCTFLRILECFGHRIFILATQPGFNRVKTDTLLSTCHRNTLKSTWVRRKQKVVWLNSDKWTRFNSIKTSSFSLSIFSVFVPGVDVVRCCHERPHLLSSDMEPKTHDACHETRFNSIKTNFFVPGIFQSQGFKFGNCFFNHCVVDVASRKIEKHLGSEETKNFLSRFRQMSSF